MLDRRGEFLTELSTGLAAIECAVAILNKLCGPLFDIELVEGHGGLDAAAFLGHSPRNARAAYAIVQARY